MFTILWSSRLHTLVIFALNLYLIKSDFSYLLLIHALWRLVIQTIRITLPLALSSIRITKPCILIARPYQLIKLHFNFDVCDFFRTTKRMRTMRTRMTITTSTTIICRSVTGLNILIKGFNRNRPGKGLITYII